MTKKSKSPRLEFTNLKFRNVIHLNISNNLHHILKCSALNLRERFTYRTSRECFVCFTDLIDLLHL